MVDGRAVKHLLCLEILKIDLPEDPDLVHRGVLDHFSRHSVHHQPNRNLCNLRGVLDLLLVEVAS